VWDKESGEPIHKAIVWQDKRTSAYCEELKKEGWQKKFQQKTGLVIDPYFSGTKLKWILDHVEGARAKAEAGQLLFGTIDTWLLWKFTNGKVHATDHTNASRTLFFNINDLDWDNELLELMNIPRSVLPDVHPSSYDFGSANIDGTDVPILGIAGDQQAALIGQGCVDKGSAKNTYGTGCFLLMHMGDEPVYSDNGLLTTLACSTSEKAQYAFEGSIFIAGAVVQWLRDGLEIINNAAETEQLARSAEGSDVVMVPAFAGLGVPYWDSSSRGAIFGLTRGTGRAHFAKAALESIAFQTRDVVETMKKETGLDMESLRVDGGACANDYLMQFQSDILGLTVDRPEILESTALGAAFLAGLQKGFWKLQDIRDKRKNDKLFNPEMDSDSREKLYAQWKDAISRTLGWKQSD